MSNNKFVKVTDVYRDDDGNVHEETNSYYEKLAFVERNSEKIIRTTRTTFLKDVLSCLDHITSDKSPRLTITIHAMDGQPVKVIKKWVTYQRELSKR